MSKGFKIALPKNKYRLLWYFSIGLFLLYIFLIGWYNTTTSNTASIFQIVPLVALPLIGIIFFLLYERKSKKRLLVLIELIVVTVASVGLFMAIINFIPTIKVASTQQVLSANDKVLTSTPTNIPTTLPTIKPTTNTQKVTQGVQIECWGPDGKSFMTTQKECDEFKNAWGISNNTNTTNNNQEETSNNVYQLCDRVSIVCTYPNSVGTINTANAFGCTYIEAYASCDKMKNSGQCNADSWSTYNQCSDLCKATRNKDLDICIWAYLGANPGVEPSQKRYEECNAEVWSNFESCHTTCSNTRASDFNSCQ